MKKKYLFIPLILFVIIAGVFLAQLIRNSQGERPTDLESVLLNKPMPNFKMEALDERLGSYTRETLVNGKPFLLTVWGTWCPSCEEEHYYLNNLAKRGIRIIGLNTKDNRRDATRWIATKGNPFAINLFDESGLTWLDLGVYGAPETFLIDSEGIIRYRLAGPMNDRVWNETIYPLWKQLGGNTY
jgi:periplasmic protein thiol:disulfide oxidoreductases, DsbE subfamily